MFVDSDTLFGIRCNKVHGKTRTRPDSMLANLPEASKQAKLHNVGEAATESKKHTVEYEEYYLQSYVKYKQ